MNNNNKTQVIRHTVVIETQVLQYWDQPESVTMFSGYLTEYNKIEHPI